MNDDSAEILFGQIRDIVMNKPVNQRLTRPSEGEEKVQDALLYLWSCINENNEFLNRMNQGNLNHATPGRKNFLASGLKELHAILQHIVWQTQQVVDGDYSQHMDYLGDLSHTFNALFDQMREREIALNQALETQANCDALLETVVRASDQLILVTNCESTEILHTNQDLEGKFERYLKDPTFYKLVRYETTESGIEKTVHYSERSNQYYLVSTREITWNGSLSLLHIIEDVTQNERTNRANIDHP